MKQTAVEWLELNMETLLMDGYKFNSEEAYNLYDQAKKMEKEQNKNLYSEEEVLDLLYYIRCNAIENEYGWQMNGENLTDMELLKTFKKK